MLFADPSIVDFLDDAYECAAVTLRPVPRAEIDFGNGITLTRTLNGNVATYFCTPAGEVVDLVPGLAAPADFLERARKAASLIGLFGEDPRSARSRVAKHHRSRAGTSGSARRVPDAGKAVVERPLKRALAGLPADPFQAGLQDDAGYNLEVRMPAVHALLAEQPLATPDALKGRLFREILGVDLEDPYLGLAPYVLGGEGGRRAP